jgi:predicted ATPase with chaperone activity
MYVRIERPSNDEMILSQKELQEIVSWAHMRMLARNPGEKNNSDLSQEELDGLKCISWSFQKELSHYVRHQKYSRRVALKMLRLCLTIADCSAINGEIPLEILWEAATYRFPR